LLSYKISAPPKPNSVGTLLACPVSTNLNVATPSHAARLGKLTCNQNHQAATNLGTPGKIENVHQN
jgi:hypothetical protein